MVFEQLFTPEKITQHPEYSLYLGIIYSLLSFITSYLLFINIPSFIGVSTLLFTVILTIPIAVKLFQYEEKLELKQKSFFKRHKVITDFFIYFFIGVFIVFFVLSLAWPDKVFSQNHLYGTTPNQITGSLPIPDSILISAIFKNNLFVMLIAFALSLFYGSGALFLIILNASIFASALATLVRTTAPAGTFLTKYSFTACNLGIMFFHMIPEVSAYLLAAIAGGVLSKAIMKEKFLSPNFIKILKNSGLLLLIALTVLFVATIIEVKLSKKLFLAHICTTHMNSIIFIALAILIGIIVLEMSRKKHFKHNKIYKSKKNKKIKR
ncbi:MAG: stage II sporulation protein M [Nanoarchaeota archaeon]|nr:stage II sporulation protein M [Nanoarchaeota archaeon]